MWLIYRLFTSCVNVCKLMLMIHLDGILLCMQWHAHTEMHLSKHLLLHLISHYQPQSCVHHEHSNHAIISWASGSRLLAIHATAHLTPKKTNLRVTAHFSHPPIISQLHQSYIPWSGRSPAGSYTSGPTRAIQEKHVEYLLAWVQDIATALALL